MTDQMTARERLRAVLNFEPVDHLPVVEWAGWWDQTMDRWYGEGLSRDLGGDDLRRHFGMDVWCQRGITAGHVPNATIVEPAIRTMDEYVELSPGLCQLNETTLDRPMWEELIEPQKRGDIVVWLTLDGPFWWPRILLGDEEMLLVYYDNPELMHRIIGDMMDFHLRSVDAICSIIQPDFMTWAEDFTYKRGPLIGRDLFDEFNAPYYRALTDRLHEHGVPCIVDTDGNPAEAVPWFTDCGVDGLWPWEARAGCDVAAVRAEHPRLLMVGGYDKTVMSQGENAIRAEFKRLLPTAKTGGFIISCDHQTPPDVSLDDYQIYLRCFREYAEAAAK